MVLHKIKQRCPLYEGNGTTVSDVHGSLCALVVDSLEDNVQIVNVSVFF